jgi:cell division protein FtsW (lipid II flippase)
MEFEWIISIVAIAIALIVIFIYILAKRIMKTLESMVSNLFLSGFDALKPKLKEEIGGWLNSEKGQKALWEIGGLIGNGAKSGLGYGGSTRGKGGLQGLLTDLIGNYIQQKVGLPNQVANTTSQKALNYEKTPEM